jgi:hypothetical protein
MPDGQTISAMASHVGTPSKFNVVALVLPGYTGEEIKKMPDGKKF